MLNTALALYALIGSASASAMSAGLAQGIAGSGSVHEYQITVQEDLRGIRVRAEFAAPVSSVGSKEGKADLLRDLQRCDAGKLDIRRNRIVGNAIDCLEYHYPIDAESGRRAPAVADGIVVSSPAQWLWLPREAAASKVRIDFSLPTATTVSVPWSQIAPNRFEVPASPGSSSASAVFGDFTQVPLEAGGTRLRVALVDGPGQRLDRDKILAWLETAASDVAGVGGRFPSPDVQVIVQPVAPRSERLRSDPAHPDRARPAGGSAVPFGYVIRDGGEAVRFFVDAERGLDDFLGDWTATHEFSHLLLPYVDSSEKWISEGFASYYQNVLLARRGVYSESEVWRRLDRAFSQADAVMDPPELARIDERPFWEVRMLIYWSGAAIALLADTRLRELSDGRESLDAVLGRLQICCLPSERVWRGKELFDQLDSLSHYPVFADLYRRYADSAGMPELEALYADLGIAAGGGQVRLRDDARLASIRQAIMRPRASGNGAVGASEVGGY